MLCYICGEDKRDRDFYRLKDYWKYFTVYKIWCRACQKMYIDMIKDEENKKIFIEKKASHVVVFI